MGNPIPGHGITEQGVQSQPWIVLVEDNRAAIELVKAALKEHAVNCEISVLRDGERALELIKELEAEKRPCPALLLLDLNTPKRDGFELLEQMRASSHCGKIPVAILSSSDAPTDKNRAARLGVTQYIRKPSNLDEFLNLGLVFKGFLEGHSPASSSTRRELEQLWRDRLRAENAKYEKAADIFRAACREHAEDPLSSRAAEKIERARKLESEAFD